MKQCLYWDKRVGCMLAYTDEDKSHKCYEQEDCLSCKNKAPGSNGYQKTCMVENSNIPLGEITKGENLKFIFSNTVDGEAYQDLIAEMKKLTTERKLNLVIWGENTGCGKTHWACQYGFYYIQKHLPNYGTMYKPNVYDDYPVQFVSVTNFIMRVKASWKIADPTLGKYIDMLKEIPLVIWDDFIVAGDYDKATQNNLFAIIDERVTNHKSNVFTTNVNPKQWEQMIGAPLTSRILGDCKVVHFRNKDLRGILI